ncbi:type I-F CRISPR-associated protein Csy2 [SAR92 clade bacterium H455]|uniref:Type I-F CRISPR-associated protein Csy2 n=1 Tax=SAR92 clade bacterium H455 TaxID=2974818 RepID=A0ABY5TJV8_9GAMM|nr:type I-F CRISPR-associated protein Csy2 [SAR92 clade bacterium H455]
MSHVSHYLLLDRIEIEGANAVSSPLTYGFPAVSGFMGAVHALNRKLVQSGLDVELSGTLIACHDIHVQRYRPHPYTDYSFNQSRNPIKKNGTTASIIEEGKAHLAVSLVVEISASRATSRDIDDDLTTIEQQCRQLVYQHPIAGGSVVAIEAVKLFDNSGEAQIKKALLPAFVLMNAQTDLIDVTQQMQKLNPEATALDALIEVSTLHHEPVPTKMSPSGWKTRSAKSGHGWLVPMPVGYQAIAPQFAPGELANSRNPEYPGQYVEAIYSLGKWVFPNRLPSDFSNCFWHYSEKENLYLFTQKHESQGA